MRCRKEGNGGEKEEWIRTPCGTSHPVWSTGMQHEVSVGRRKEGHGGEGEERKKNGMDQNTVRNVTSGLRNSLKAWVHRGWRMRKRKGKRNRRVRVGKDFRRNRSKERKKKGGGQKNGPEFCAERYIRSGICTGGEGS